ncbi:tRNA 2-selenouridine(34) synthase MnmH [Natronincola ferrireducens]|nr:tRNA 2-selenouridine(34) synthase MnmH [Natronincola ferrireducens]
MEIKIEDAIYKNNCLFIDVRSPFEFNEGTVPRAINIPLFDDEERIIVGKIYKNESIDRAKDKGVELASLKLPYIYRKISEMRKVNDTVIVFCSRGGLRSGAVVSFLNNLGVSVYQLQGGYKAFRKFTMKYLEDIQRQHEFIVLHGYTGVGKTKILNILEDRNIPVINFAKLAQNTGSVFGDIVFNGASTTQKMFDATIVDKLIKYNKKLVVVESESKRLGSIFIPIHLYNSIIKGRHVLIATSIENRGNRLINDYTNNNLNCHDLLIKSITSLKKRIGTENMSKYIEYVHNKNYRQVAEELIINYYDPIYKNSIEKYKYELLINYDKIEKAADEVEAYYHKTEGEIQV